MATWVWVYLHSGWSFLVHNRIDLIVVNFSMCSFAVYVFQVRRAALSFLFAVWHFSPNH